MNEQQAGPDAPTTRISGPAVRWMPWIALAAWLVTAVLGGGAVSDAITDRSVAVRCVVLIGTWTGWAIGALALAVWSTVSLTIARTLVPASVAVGAASWIAGAETTSALLLLVPAAVATLLVGTAEFAGAMVQASAYGDEARVPLRPPLGFLIMAVLTWVATAAATIGGTLLVAATAGDAGLPTVIGVVLAAAGVAGCWFFGRRWHLLSRRWLVFVPAGLVVHDAVVLGETLMVRRIQVAAVHLAYADTTALDLTGPAAGHAIEISVHNPATVVPVPQRRGEHPRPTTATSFLVAPSRPGRALVEAARRRLPTGPLAD